MVEPFSQIIWVNDPTLPIPWKSLIDPSTGWLYFWNPVTNVTQYQRPSAPLCHHHHHQFYMQQNPYPWLPRYDWPQPQYSHQYPNPAPHRVLIPINYPRHRSFLRGESEDKISELPDELISHILCFLPTISAVRTTVLSKRWNKLWTSVRHLDFDECRDMNRQEIPYDYESCFEKLVDFVFLHLSSLDIGKFRLKYTDITDHKSDYLEKWVDACVSRNVVELDLQMLVFDRFNVDVPTSIFCCKTLKILKLWIEKINIPELPTSAGCVFPSLKIFHLTGVDFYTQMRRLLSYFPVLEDLSIHLHVTYYYSVYDRINIVKVSAPELKTLRLSMESSDLDNHNDGRYYYDESPELYRFCVDAPKLENLEAIHIPFSEYILENPKSVVNASIAFESLVEDEEYRPPFPDRVYKLLTGISNVKCLSLSDQPIKVSHLPVFGNLNQLRLVLRNRSSWELLTALLQKTPNLEHLDLLLEDGDEVYYPELEWNPPAEVVPDCLSSNIKTISIRRFKGLEAETKLAKYMLLNGCHLSRMTIHTCVLEKEEACKDLMTFPRAMTCQVEFKEM